MLMPSFHRYPKEAALIGRILAGYGELEFLLAECLGYALKDRETGVRTYFRIVSERTRLSTADALLQKPLHAMKLSNKYSEVCGAIRFCLKLRNTYAHCHWADLESDPGLYFTNAQTAAEGTKPMDYEWFHVDESLLIKQEDYFYYTQLCLMYLSDSVRYHQEERKAPLPRKWPSRQVSPSLHNPPELHVPPWQPSSPATQPLVQTPKQKRENRRKP
jgi:Arc/MetJ family transcription regulator